MATRTNPEATGQGAEINPAGAYDSFGMRGTLTTALLFFESLDTPRSLTCALMIQYSEFHQLVRLTVKPSDYLHAAEFRSDYAATKYLSKLRGLSSDQSLEDEALRGFKAAEDRCASTNVRLTNGNPLPGAETLLLRVREKIFDLLGPPDVKKVVSLCGWGPGATATIKGDEVSPENKLLEPRLSVTKRLLPLARAIVGDDLHWCRARLGIDVEGPCTPLFNEFDVIEWMRVVTVAKDSKSDRTIGAEPTLNTYVQKGIGRFIRQRLKRVGIDLDDQRVNQSWAAMALEFSLATVDLKSASDLISYWLVELLLPPAWFRLLDIARSGYAVMPGTDLKKLGQRGHRPKELEKFSSMGNGYTFELETLIFYAIAMAVTEEVGASTCCVSVYGDDVIVPQAAYSRLVEIFQLFGFLINTEKSYATGLFFESCGEHYFNGARVTPIYQKEATDDLPQLIRAHNRLARWADGADQTVYVDAVVLTAITHLKQLASDIMRIKDNGPHQGPRPGLRIPTIPWRTLGDDGFMVFEVRTKYCPDRGFLCRVIKILPRKRASLDDAPLLAVTVRGSSRAAGYLEPDYYPADKRIAALIWLIGEADDHTPFFGVVTLRGDSGYKLTRRWIQPLPTRKMMFS